jgi:hypothetical protein
MVYGSGRVPLARAYVGRRVFPMLLLYAQDAGLNNRPFTRRAGALEGLRPVFFGPCTPVRTWGTRPGKWAGLLSTATQRSRTSGAEQAAEKVCTGQESNTSGA